MRPLINLPWTDVTVITQAHKPHSRLACDLFNLEAMLVVFLLHTFQANGRGFIKESKRLLP